ncbi:MAG: DNA mismatch repair endonuclease MutL [Candidatus Aminicenantes bacterium]|nr:DNA mismatch repair endonuclease MutL [Candidatus Aminicenantes bacterium]
MAHIKVLPDEVSQKIAAGEVIERPFSVVKELVENALDAHAADIKVELKEGGKSLIKVTDNGVGMSREDALICFERHSTSKITGENDLDRISTLGFRGEALPSISSVSRVALKTFENGDVTGTMIEREGEVLLQVSDAAFPVGTSVEVRDLFFNLPARRKFLKSDRSELSQIATHLIHLSLAYAGVGFSLSHGKRRIFHYPAVSSLKERLYQVFGKHLLGALVEVGYEEGSRKISGFSSRPPSGRRDRTRQLFYVNGRFVKDKVCQAALIQAYKGLLEREHFPEAFLFLDIPLDEVDVNVHPAKTEVRFHDSSAVFRLVHRGVEAAVLREMGLKEVYPIPAGEKPGPEVRESVSFPAMKERSHEKGPPGFLFPRIEKEPEGQTKILGQYLDLYIIAADEDGLFIIDQHNAHERVLFEKYEELDRKKSWPGKMTLLPELFELSSSQILSLENNQALIEETGFRAEFMGGRTYSLKEYPDIFEEKAAREVFLSLLDELSQEKIKDRKKKLLATMACKTAVKAGQPLSTEKMAYLVDELFKTSNPSLCPHGRPITLRIGRRTIAKELKRAPDA